MPYLGAEVLRYAVFFLMISNIREIAIPKTGSSIRIQKELVNVLVTGFFYLLLGIIGITGECDQFSLKSLLNPEKV